MPTNIGEARIESFKSRAAPSAVRAGIAILCMIGLVAGLVLLSSLMGTPDLSDIGQLVGP